LTEELLQQECLTIDGGPLSLTAVCEAANSSGSQEFRAAADVPDRMRVSVEVVREAVDRNRVVYGVTTGFGGMAEATVDRQLAAASQNNLLSFLATAAGPQIDRRHVRAAMLLRANVLARGCSGIRFEIVERLLKFLAHDATPVVREYGSIGASGDLVPLSTIARAVTGKQGRVQVQLGDQLLDGPAALRQLGFETLELLPKEGLAIVNGTSFSAAIAGHATYEGTHLLALATATQAMMLQALLVHHEPFADFVHRCKPHPGQVWMARTMRDLLVDRATHPSRQPVQDRYSLRCLPQYLGPVVEGLARITDVIETEMNAISDNPLIDVATGDFHQSGNFLGQYVGVAMDELRRHIGLMAKHLDVQIAAIATPEFSNGLPASLQGNADIPYNMGLKGLQITGNSIMPMLTWLGNPLVEHFPTHAEQYNQNINGLSWGAALQAWKSVELFQHYMSVAMIFAVQAIDLRARQQFGHFDGRSLLGPTLSEFYESICVTIGTVPGKGRPLLFDDGDVWLEEKLEQLTACVHQRGVVVQAVDTIRNSFRDSMRTDTRQ
jgi:phenylalanine ammonia-lyase